MQTVPDSNDVLAQELSDNIVRGINSNKRRKRLIAELRRSAPIVEHQSRDETLKQFLEQWIY